LRNITFRILYHLTQVIPSTPITLSLHDALPICTIQLKFRTRRSRSPIPASDRASSMPSAAATISPAATRARTRMAQAEARTSKRSEEHTSELQSPCNLVCRLLLEKKNNLKFNIT